MKKILLIFMLIGFGLWNYRLISFKDGLNIVNLSSDPIEDHFFTQLSFFTGISNVYYYNNPMGDDYILVVHSKTEGIRMGTATSEQINNLNTAGLLFKGLKPQSVNIIPLWVYALGILFILFLPNNKKPIRATN